jgi:5-formyltetrahydrofolate cyclo-ligase
VPLGLLPVVLVLFGAGPELLATRSQTLARLGRQGEDAERANRWIPGQHFGTGGVGKTAPVAPVADELERGVPAAKAALRATLRAARAARDAAARDTAGAALAAAVGELFVIATPTVVAGYLSVGSEPPTSWLLATLHAHGVRLLVPVLRRDADLDWVPYLPGEPVHEGLRGTAEPVSATVSERLPITAADVILVPALAVDLSGHRLGRGGGSYDRALRLRRATTEVFGVLYESEWLAEVPTELHDVPVDGALAPSGLRRIR